MRVYIILEDEIIEEIFNVISYQNNVAVIAAGRGQTTRSFDDGLLVVNADEWDAEHPEEE